MPYMRNGKRDYKRENELYNSRPEQRKARSERTTLRNELIKEGRVHRGDGKDVDHIKPLSKGGANTTANARVVSAGENRSFSRGLHGELISQRSKRERKK